MSRITAVSHDKDGSIGKYQLDDGRILSRDEAVKEVSAGNIEGVSTFTTRDGSEAIRSDRGQQGYSLDELPEIK